MKKRCGTRDSYGFGIEESTTSLKEAAVKKLKDGSRMFRELDVEESEEKTRGLVRLRRQFFVLFFIPILV